MTFESNVDAINLELETRLKEITRLEQRVIRAVPGTTRFYPTVWIQLERIEEDMEAEGTLVSNPRIEHTLVYNLKFEDRWDQDEDAVYNENEKIKRWGEVRDKLRTYTTNAPKWDLLWIPSLEYAQITRDARYCMLDIEAELRVVKAW